MSSFKKVISDKTYEIGDPVFYSYNKTTIDHSRYETYLTWFMNKFIIEQEVEQKEEIEETLFQYLLNKNRKHRTKYSGGTKIQESIKYD